MMIRLPAVAGMFYPADPQELENSVEKYLLQEAGAALPAKVVILPHAGYQYSGHVAGITLVQVTCAKRFLVLGPNHYGVGQAMSLQAGGAWRTPLGDYPIDTDFAVQLQQAIPELREDPTAYRQEHSLEVEIPFLQKLQPTGKFVPLCLSYLSYADCEQVGRGIAQVLRKQTEPVQIICSTDFNHYEDQATTETKDHLAIDRILSLDPQGLYEVCRTHGISMCGVIPTTIALVAAQQLGATQARLIRHATSGDMTGDYSAVVGYGGLIVN